MTRSRDRRFPPPRRCRGRARSLLAAALLAAALAAPAAAARPGLPPDLPAAALENVTGPVYVVEAYPRARAARPAGVRVLAEWEGAALVTASPAALDSLAALGYEVRRVMAEAPRAPVPPAGPTAVTAYDVRIQALMGAVVQADLVAMLNGLSGETAVTVGGASVTLATRNSYKSTCRQAEQYAYETLQGAGLAVEYQAYGASGWRNVVGTLTGQTRPGRQVLLTAHLDDMPGNTNPTAPGADDNGSGTVAVLRAAQLLAPRAFDKTLRFVCFTGEEQGLLGSYAYAQAAAARGDTIDAVVNLDMIAYESNDADVMELHAGNLAASGAIADAFADVVFTYGLGLVCQKVTAGATNASDHSAFWAYGYPAVLAIEDFDDFTPYYHTPQDRVPTLDADYYTRLARAAIGTVVVLAGPAWTVDVESREPVARVVLGPNPTRRGAVLRYSTPEAAAVGLELFDLSGRRLRALGGEIRPAGPGELRWDGLDAAGAAPPAGILFYRARVGQKVISGRLAILR